MTIERIGLIDAAPELLESLVQVMSWIDNWSPEFTDDPDWPKDRDAAYAAIAKATGETAFRERQAAEVLKQALEALEEAHHVIEHKQDATKRGQAITAIKEALAQPKQQEKQDD